MAPTAELPPVTPFTCQDTWVLVDPLTVALNCFCWFSRTLADVGLMLRETVPHPRLRRSHPPTRWEAHQREGHSCKNQQESHFASWRGSAHESADHQSQRSYHAVSGALVPRSVAARMIVPFGPAVLMVSVATRVPLAPLLI